MACMARLQSSVTRRCSCARRVTAVRFVRDAGPGHVQDKEDLAVVHRPDVSAARAMGAG